MFQVKEKRGDSELAEESRSRKKKKVAEVVIRFFQMDRLQSFVSDSLSDPTGYTGRG